MTDREQHPRPPKAAPAARIAWALLALACLGLMAWTATLMRAEMAFNRLPPVTEELDRRVLAALSIELPRLLRRDPTNGEIRNAYASVLGRQGRHRQAAEELRRALRTQNAQNSLYFLANMHDRMGEKAEAERLMADCVVINPSNARFTPSWLRILSRRLEVLQEAQRNPDTDEDLLDPVQWQRARQRYAMAARDWSVRAPHDPNSYLFMGNFHVDQMYGHGGQRYLLQAYRYYLLGLSHDPHMSLNRTLMLDPARVRHTIGQILQHNLAKPYRNLP